MPHVLSVVPQLKHVDKDTNKTFLIKKLIIITILGFTLSGCGGGGSDSPASAQAQTISTQNTVVLADLVFTAFSSSDIDGVHSVSCPVDQLAIAASCTCGLGSGPMFSLQTVNNGALCGCRLGPGPTEEIDVIVNCSKAKTATVLTSATIQKPTGKSLPDEATIKKWAEGLAAEEARLHEMRAMR